MPRVTRKEVAAGLTRLRWKADSWESAMVEARERANAPPDGLHFWRLRIQRDDRGGRRVHVELHYRRDGVVRRSRAP